MTTATAIITDSKVRFLLHELVLGDPQNGEVLVEIKASGVLTCPLDPHIRKYDFGFEGGIGMSRSKHSEAQIIVALKQVEAGRTAEDVARECGVSKHTIYAWKARLGGMEATEAQKLRSLEDENGRLKRLVADLSLDREMLKAVIAKTA